VNDVDAANIIVNVYPNPATDFVQIEAPDEKIISIKVLDAQAKVIVSTAVNKHFLRLDTHLWSKGNYFIEVETEAGTMNKKMTVH
jgi:DNA polymerase IIIc chi subunit